MSAGRKEQDGIEPACLKKTAADKNMFQVVVVLFLIVFEQLVS